MADYTDFYKAIQDGWLERLRYALQTDFLIDKIDIKVSTNEANLQFGFDYFIVMKPGPFVEVPQERMNDGREETYDWTTRMELFTRFYEKSEEGSRMAAFRDAVIFHVWKNRRMAAATINGHAVAEVAYVDRVRSVNSAADVTYYQLFNKTSNFSFQPLVVVTRQHIRLD